jgi:two-component system sensor histidine kinase KdpD
VTLVGDDIAEEVVAYARSQNVTRIVIGKSRESRWRALIAPNVVDRLLRESGDIDIYVIQGLGEPEGAPPASPPPRRRGRTCGAWPVVRMVVAGVAGGGPLRACWRCIHP